MAQAITVLILLVCFIFQLVLYSNLEYSQLETQKVFRNQVDIVVKIQENLDHFETIQHQINDNRDEFYLYVSDLYANIERLKRLTNQ
jgi:cell division protein FtsX